MNASSGLGPLFRGVAVLVLAMLSVSCAESEFDFTEDSRLPVWFKVPEGKTRADMTLHVTFYIVGRPTVQGDFVLRDGSGRTIAKATGNVSNTHGGISFPELTVEEPPEMGGDTRPRDFDVITVGGVTEVFEYRGILDEKYQRRAVVFVCDDPEVRKRLGVPMRGETHALQ
jgi:hypothetical protein